MPRVQQAGEANAQIREYALVAGMLSDRQPLGRVNAQVLLHPCDHRNLLRPLLGIPKRCIDKGPIGHPDGPRLMGQGVAALRIVAQQPHLMTTAGIGQYNVIDSDAQVLKR